MELDPIFEMGLKDFEFEKNFLKGSKIGRIRFKAPPNNLYINFIMSKLGLKLLKKRNNYAIMHTTMATQELYVVIKQKKQGKYLCQRRKNSYKGQFFMFHIILSHVEWEKKSQAF
jgi:hypothetical protein